MPGTAPKNVIQISEFSEAASSDRLSPTIAAIAHGSNASLLKSAAVKIVASCRNYLLATALVATFIVIALNFTHRSTVPQPASQALAPAIAILPTTVNPPLPAASLPQTVTTHPASKSRFPEWLVLTRTFPGKTSKEGFADIGTAPNATKRYMVGSLLANKSCVSEVYADRVILERDGKTSTLYVIGQQPAAYQPQLPSLVLISHAESAESVTANSRDDLSEVIRAAPVFSNNAFRGLVVYSGRLSTLFSSLGLQAGDVITAIDGKTFNSSGDALNALRPLLNGKPIGVTIERGEQSTVIVMDGSVITPEQLAVVSN